MKNFHKNKDDNLLSQLRGMDKKKRPKSERVVRILPETSQNISLDVAVGHIGVEVKQMKKDLTPLSKPLEKPASKRIARASGFEKVAVEASRYEGIVARRRKADMLSFPLQRNDCRVITSEKSGVPELKTSLEKKVYTLLYGEDYFKEVEEKSEHIQAIEKAMSLKEIEQKSREIWKEKLMRIRLEQKIALQNKSKSKTNRRVNRRSKLSYRVAHAKPVSEEEVKLEEDKQRVMERISLRHRNSKWVMRQKKVNSKKKLKSTDLDLANTLSQNLTAKAPLSDDEDNDGDEDKEDSDEDMNFEDIQADDFMKHFQKNNPWLISNKDGNQESETLQVENVEENSLICPIKNGNDNTKKRKKKEINALPAVSPKKKEKCEKNDKVKKRKVKLEENTDIKPSKKKNKEVKLKTKDVNGENFDIDDIFDNAESILSSTRTINKEKKMKTKIEKKKKNSESKKTNKIKRSVSTKKKREEKAEFDFSVEKDEELLDERMERIAGIDLDKLQDEDYNWETSENTLAINDETEDTESNIRQDSSDKVVEFDAAKLTEMTPRSMQSQSRVHFDDDDDDSDEDAQQIIRDAFKDDYIMDEFRDEKEKEAEGGAPLKDENKLKGWGSWTGPGVVERKNNRSNRRRRFKGTVTGLRPTTEPPKRTAMGNVIYNQKADLHENIQSIMVQKVPYPFQSVKEYEASLSTPCGRLYVPEIAHQKMIKPDVKTKIGAVIEPMGDDQLLKGGRKNREEKLRWKENLKKNLEKKLSKNRRIKL